jgi:PIN domain nuclease of toxin-antitoxin system
MMRLLLDTQIVYWFFYEPQTLTKATREHMTNAEAVFVSSASIWEIAIKVRILKINANPKRIVQLMPSAGFHELPIFSRHTVIVADLPMHHADPFDRLLVAQAIAEPLNLITTDAQLRQYSDLVIHI